MKLKIFIETTVEAESEDAAREFVKALFVNPHEIDVDLAIAAVEPGYLPNGGSYREHVVKGQMSRDHDEIVNEKIARSHGWDQGGGMIYNASTYKTESAAVADPDGVVYDSWTKCVAEEKLTGVRPGSDIPRLVPRVVSEDHREVAIASGSFVPVDSCHPVKQRIRSVQIDAIEGQESSYDADRSAGKGFGMVTLIEACTKPGLHSDIPYIRVWSNDTVVAEFCQHQIVGVYFFPED